MKRSRAGPARRTLSAALFPLATLERRPLCRDASPAAPLRTGEAKPEFKKNLANGLVLLAKIAADGNRYTAHDIAHILALGLGEKPDIAASLCPFTGQPLSRGSAASFFTS